MELQKELDQWRHKHFKGKRDNVNSGEYLERESQLDISRHFYNLALEDVRKECNRMIRNYNKDSENTIGIYPYTLKEVISFIDQLSKKIWNRK